MCANQWLRHTKNQWCINLSMIIKHMSHRKNICEFTVCQRNHLKVTNRISWHFQIIWYFVCAYCPLISHVRANWLCLVYHTVHTMMKNDARIMLMFDRESHSAARCSRQRLQYELFLQPCSHCRTNNGWTVKDLSMNQHFAADPRIVIFEVKLNHLEQQQHAN